MTRRRWIADGFDADRAWLVGANAAHLARVLRARPGDVYDVVCGGRLRTGTVSAVSDERVEFALRVEDEAATEFATELATQFATQVSGGAGCELVLVAAIYKFDRLEWAIEKCTELGVGRIVPVIARRTDAHLAAASAKRVERWRRIAHEASQQSRRLTEPQIDEPVKIEEAVQVQAATRLLLNEDERGLRLHEALRIDRNIDRTPELRAGEHRSGEQGMVESLAFAVGPEGGWTSGEVAAFVAAGWQSVSLGRTILRAETAAIAALAAAAAILE